MKDHWSTRISYVTPTKNGVGTWSDTRRLIKTSYDEDLFYESAPKDECPSSYGTPSDSAKVPETWRATDLLQSFDQGNLHQILTTTKHHVLLLAEHDQIIVGAVNAFFGRWIGYIHHLGVHPDYQRRGIGSLLLHEMCQQLKERNVQLATLLIPVKSTQIKTRERTRFYRRNGFHSTGKFFFRKL